MSVVGAMLCRAGFHRPRGDARWNAGYGFTTCARCGCDLVRSKISGWQVPQGHRVVWIAAERPVPAATAKAPQAIEEPEAELLEPSEAIGVPEPELPEPKAEPVRLSPFDFSDFEDDDDEAVAPRSSPKPAHKKKKKKHSKHR